MSSDMEETESGSTFVEYIFSGKVLNDRYILIDTIGRGTFACVWSCYDIKTKSFFAVKIQDIEEHECAMDEFNFYTTINKGGNAGGAHVFLSTMTDYFALESDYGVHDCFVFNLAACSTYDIIRYIKYYNGDDTVASPLTPQIIKQIIYQTLLAIKSINENYNLLHTDIRAENILVMGVNKKMEVFKTLFDPNHIEKSVIAKRKKFIKKYKKKKIPVEAETEFYESTSIPYIQKLLSDPIMLPFSNDDDDETSCSHNRSLKKSCHGSKCNINRNESQSNDDSTDGCSNGDCDHDQNSSTHSHVRNKKNYDQYDNFSDFEDYTDDVMSEEIFKEKVCDALPLNEKYLEKIHIKLADFGSACFADKKYNSIQARHYRAPEVVIGNEFNESCDIWSLGCLLFELLTGEVLFKPNKSVFISRNKFHLYKMYQLFGPLPASMINSCKHRKLFFNKDGTLKINRYIEPLNLKKLIIEEINKRHVKLTINDEELNQIVEFMMLTFEYDPKMRPTASTLCSHAWFNDVKIQ
jgi:serine/threonine-protein kinase SRPK3